MAGLCHLARHRLPIAVLVASGVLVIAGCGSSSKPSSANTSATTSSSANTSATTSSSANTSATTSSSAKHERDHIDERQQEESSDLREIPARGSGLHTFARGAELPGSDVRRWRRSGQPFDPPGMLTSPGFELAERQCAKLGLDLAGYAPTSTATAAEMAQALAVAKCMRAHGVPNWPDPTKTCPATERRRRDGRGAGPAGRPDLRDPKVDRHRVARGQTGRDRLPRGLTGRGSNGQTGGDRLSRGPTGGVRRGLYATARRWR